MTLTSQPGPSMPDCDLNLLAAYAERRLDSGEEARVTRHLAECWPCREALAGLAGLEADRRRALFASPMRSAWLPLAAGVAVAAGATLMLLSRSARVLAPHPAARVAAAPPPGSSTAPPSSPPLLPGPPAGSASPTTTPRPAPIDETLLASRGAAATSVAGKTFRLSAGAWIDTAFDPGAALPIVEAVDAAERRALLERVPALAPYAALGERVVVAWEGRVYRLGPPRP